MPSPSALVTRILTVALLALSSPLAFAEEPTVDQSETVAQAETSSVELGEAEQKRRTPPSALEEIVVTAERRESLLQDTPIAVSAFGHQKMEDLRINSAQDYAMLVPSLSVRASPNRVFIRGVGRTDNALGLDPGVALYTDGLYFAEDAPLYSNSLGTERVEVLRGPQGTLYGRSATGGAVNVVSQRPSEEFRAEGRIVLGDNRDRSYAGLVSGPITEWLRYEFLHSDYRNNASNYDNIAGSDGGRYNGYYMRTQLEMDVTDDITAWVKWEKSHYRNHIPGDTGIRPYIRDASDPRCLGPRPGDAWSCQTVPIPGSVLNGGLSWNSGFQSPVENPGVRSAFNKNQNDPIEVWCEDCWSTIWHLDWDLGPVALKYIGGYRTYDWNYHGDYDGTSRMEDELRYLLYIRQDHNYHSHELRLSSQTGGKLEWQAGVYYYNEELEQPFTIHNPFNSNLQQICVSCGPGTTWWNTSELAPNVAPWGGHYTGVLYGQQGKLKSVAWAAFAEMYYSLTDTLEITLGLRHNVDRKHGEEERMIIGDPRALYGLDYENGFLIPDCCTWDFGTQRQRHRDRWKALSGRVVLNWTPDDDTLVYASIAQGYKPGGFRLGPMEERPQFDKETLWSYEIGAKRTFFDRLRLNTAAYFYVYEDMQVLNNILAEGTNIAQATVINADRAEVYGFELESVYQATDSLSFFGNYSYMNGEFKDFCCFLDTSFPDQNGNGIPNEPEDLQDLKGKDTIQSPDHKVILGATYNWLTDWGTFSLTGQWSWVDEQTYSIWGLDADYGKSYHRTSAFLSWSHWEDKYRVIFYGKNLEDDENYNTVNHPNVNGGQTVVPNAARNFGVEIHLRY